MKSEPLKKTSQIIAVESYLKTRFDFRYYMIFQFAKDCLLRVSDVLPLRYHQVFKPDGTVRDYFFITEKKTKKQKTLFMSNLKPDLIKYRDWLKKTLRKRELPLNYQINYLFPTFHKSSNQFHKGNKGYISRPALYRAFRITGDDLRIKHFTTQSCRKTGAYLVYVQSGYNIAFTMHQLNHSTERQTLFYLGLPNKRTENVLNQFNFH